MALVGPSLSSRGWLNMKRILLFVLVVAATFALVYIATSGRAVEAAKASCAGCRADLASVLPKNHPEVKGKGISA